MPGQKDNVIYIKEAPGSGGNGGNGNLRERVAKLEERTEHLATREDIQGVRVWILGGVIGGLIAAVPIALLTIKLFSKIFQ